MAGQGKDNVGGLAARRKRRTRVLIIIPLVVALAVIAGLVSYLKPWHSRQWQDVFSAHGSLTTSPEPTPADAPAQLVPVPDNAPQPTAAGLAAALGPLVANPVLGVLAGAVSDASTGVQLWSAQADRPMVPASTTKVLTAAAALLALPLDHRVTTSVVQGATPDELVLVGGGDPTLTAQQAGRPNFYSGAPHLDDLVAQIQRSGIRPGNIVVDTSAYSGPTLAKGWFAADIAGGSIAPIEPVMLDGGRLKPLDHDSPRSGTPALDAGRVLAQRLGIDPARVRIGTAPQGATPVATVQSALLRERLTEMMVESDDVLAETIGREIAVATGAPAAFTGSVSGVDSALRKAGFDMTGVSLSDTSGLSVDDRIPARALDGVLSAAAGHGKPTLRPMLDYLPVAGGTGTLSDRYAAVNRSGAGWVRAKTGSLTGVNSLAGYVVDGSNRVLTFALMSNGGATEASRAALDAIASALRSCGCR